jgi:threonine dehydrogenase-like Zn-dependent dehydrogenase
MRALTVRPGVKDSLAVSEIAEPPPGDGPVLVDAIAVGLCGTDGEIVAGQYGQAPDGDDLLVLGHENLGRVREAPDGSGLAPGDLVVGIVRRPDPVPCGACAAGEWDMCQNGRYVEHGIKGLHGFARERWRAQVDAVVKVDAALGPVAVLLEPTTIVAKAWEQIERIGSRAFFAPRTTVVTGAGPVGLLAALLGVQRGLDVHVVDRVTDGPKPALVEAIGATYHARPLPEIGVDPDIVIECTGAPPVVLDVLNGTGNNGIACLTGVSTVGAALPFDVGGMNRDAVLQNDVVFGTVNANRRHYEAAALALAKADLDLLDRLITRHLTLDDVIAGFARRPDDVKVVLDLE